MKTMLADLATRHRYAVLKHLWRPANMNEVDKKLLHMIRNETCNDKCLSIMEAFTDRILDRMDKVCVLAYKLVVDCYAHESPRRWRIRWREKYQVAWNVFEFRLGGKQV